MDGSRRAADGRARLTLARPRQRLVKEAQSTEAEIKDAFRYHSPSRGAVEVHEGIRQRMTGVVAAIARVLPHSRERSTFITHMQQAQMTANAAAAIHGLPAVPRQPEVTGNLGRDGFTYARPDRDAV